MTALSSAGCSDCGACGDDFLELGLCDEAESSPANEARKTSKPTDGKSELDSLVFMKPRKKEIKAQTRSAVPLLQQLARRPEKLFAGAFRQQYGALCFRYVEGGPEIEILLITSRDSGRWIIPKGWPMKKKKPCEAAAIEAWEEAGLRGTVRKQPVGRYTYLKELDDGDVAPCIVDVFQVEATEVRSDFKETGQRVLSWVSPDEAARRVREIELKSLLVDFKPRRLKKAAPKKHRNAAR